MLDLRFEQFVGHQAAFVEGEGIGTALDLKTGVA